MGGWSVAMYTLFVLLAFLTHPLLAPAVAHRTECFLSGAVYLGSAHGVFLGIAFLIGCLRLVLKLTLTAEHAGDTSVNTSADARCTLSSVVAGGACCCVDVHWCWKLCCCMHFLEASLHALLCRRRAFCSSSVRLAAEPATSHLGSLHVPSRRLLR